MEKEIAKGIEVIMTLRTETLTVVQVSKALRVSPRTIRNWIASGYFKGWFKLKTRWRIKPEDLQEFLKSREESINGEE